MIQIRKQKNNQFNWFHPQNYNSKPIKQQHHQPAAPQEYLDINGKYQKPTRDSVKVLFLNNLFLSCSWMLRRVWNKTPKILNVFTVLHETRRILISLESKRRKLCLNFKIKSGVMKYAIAVTVKL